MHLSRFGVKNYKCLVDIDIPLTPIHVLIGQNDAGKTSLLEAMAALYASGKKPISEVFPEPWEGRELVFHGSAESLVTLEGQWRPPPDEEDSWRLLRCGGTVTFAQQGKAADAVGWLFQIDGRDCGVPGRSQPYSFLKDLPIPPEGKYGGLLDSFRKSLSPGPLISLDTRLLGMPAAYDTERKLCMDADGFGLPTLLDDILGYNVDLYVHLRDEFCKTFRQFRTVRVETEMGVTRHRVLRGHQFVGHQFGREGVGKAIYFETKSGQSIRAQQASAGALLFLAFLALAHLPEPPSLLLVEEPENGVHPKRLVEVIELLKGMVYRTEGPRFPQIIMTTHSPYVLSLFTPEEVTLLSRDPKTDYAGVRARPLREAKNLQKYLAGDEFYLGEVWYNLDEEELFGEP